jgi:hypothetical protein
MLASVIAWVMARRGNTYAVNSPGDCVSPERGSSIPDDLVVRLRATKRFPVVLRGLDDVTELD